MTAPNFRDYHGTRGKVLDKYIRERVDNYSLKWGDYLNL